MNPVESALARCPTTAEVWAPAFSWEPESRLFRPERLFQLESSGPLSGLFRCALCECFLHTADAAHVAEHCREYRAWQAARRREADQRRREVLRTVNRERRAAA